VWRTHGQNNRTILHCKYQHSSLQRTNWTVTNGMTKNCAATSKKFTDHCTTDARKYCKMLCLLMLRKLEKWYGSSSTPKLYQHSTPKSLLGGGHPLPRLHPSMCSRVILQTNRHTHTCGWSQYLPTSVCRCTGKNELCYWTEGMKTTRNFMNFNHYIKLLLSVR